MQIQFSPPRRSARDFAPAALLAAVLCSALAALGQLSLLPVALTGVAISVAGQFLKPKKPLYLYALLGLLVVYLLVRFSAVLDGVKLLINQLYSRSEMQQAYEYEYFEIVQKNPWEAVLWLSMFAGALCALWESRFAAFISTIWAAAMIYFGVTPGLVWLALLGAACLWNVAPLERAWLHGGVIVLLMIVVALVVRAVAPAPNATISAWDNQMRDRLALHSVYYEQTVSPTEVPQPEQEPQPSDPPPEQDRLPDQGIRSKSINVLFIVSSVVTAVLLFSYAILKDRTEKRRMTNRAGLDDADNAAAIRAMYLYAGRWRKLADTPSAVPEQVRAVWLEAAYSEHEMTDAQRQTMYAYMEQTAASVWEAADRKKRLRIRYRIAL